MDNDATSDKETSAGQAGHAETGQYDRGIVPAEVAARREREGEDFKHTPGAEQGANADNLDTTGGYTVDQEGLLNNYAVEPEMYINEPGDLRQAEEAQAAERAEELQEVNEDSEGNLTAKRDERSKGPGLV